MHTENLYQQNKLNQKGDFYLDRYEYKKAIDCYNRAFKKDTSSYYSLLRKAEALTKLNFSHEAEECYRMVIESGKPLENEYYLKYALTLLVNKKYDDSRKWLDIYNSKVDSDIRGKNYLKSINNKDILYRDSIIQIVENVNELNTKESEINPIYFNHKIIFASARITSIDAVKNGFYDIYSADISSTGEYSKEGSINKYINTDLHEGPIAISENQSKLFLTRNIPEQDTNQHVKLGIYETSIPKSATEKITSKLISIEGFPYNIGHPAINYNGNIMYFISSAPTGFGGLDLYKSERVDGRWTYPKNLGNEINTQGDEMFPYLRNDSILYFASDGHGGLGGLDIFKVNLTNPDYQPQNLGYPINSPFDDFSIFFKPGSESGYFCSNRPGGVGSDDIYMFNILRFKIKGTLRDTESKKILQNAKISLLQEDEEEYMISKTQTGNFEFSIIPGENYTLYMEIENYTPEKVVFKAEKNFDKVSKMLIEMKPIRTAQLSLESGQKYDFVFGNNSLNLNHSVDLDKIAVKEYTSYDSLINYNIMSKNMENILGDIFSMHLIKSGNIKKSIHSRTKPTLILFNTDTLNFDNDSILFTLPIEEKSQLTFQSDLKYILQNYDHSEISFQVDSAPIPVQEKIVINADQQKAIEELEYLLNLSFKDNENSGNRKSITSITARGF
ncbi:MAG: hypothetical protein MI922_18765, partial [Bacteroidales bacterium]|nr:hypothetical protein [Bacteroidales bacterium]